MIITPQPKPSRTGKSAFLKRITVDPRRIGALKAKNRRSLAEKKSQVSLWFHENASQPPYPHPQPQHTQQEASVDVAQFRTIALDQGKQQPGHVNNHVVTAKYNVFTFLPKFLFEVFSRVAYMYFLVQMILSWIPVISPFGGVGSTAALLFVVIVSGITAIMEDVKRYNEDRATNRSIAHVVQHDGMQNPVLFVLGERGGGSILGVYACVWVYACLWVYVCGCLWVYACLYLSLSYTHNKHTHHITLHINTHTHTHTPHRHHQGCAVV